MKIFMSDNVPEIIEKGGSPIEYPLWSTKTEQDGKVVHWLGTEITVWVIIANVLHGSSPEGKAIGEAIAYEFGLIKNEEPKNGAES